MSKVIEELNNLVYGGQENPITISFDITKFFQVIREVRNELQRLESIDNANSSEALKCLERIDNTLCLNNNKGKLEFGIDTEEHSDCDSAIGMVEDLETIKQALLQQQEPKKYLTWEDLDFKEISQLDHKIIKAKLDEQLYELDLYRYGGYKRVEIREIGKSYDYNLDEGYVGCIDEEFPETIQFFDNLHLEMDKD